jgi:hypothetical protein
MPGMRLRCNSSEHCTGKVGVPVWLVESPATNQLAAYGAGGPKIGMAAPNVFFPAQASGLVRLPGAVRFPGGVLRIDAGPFRLYQPLLGGAWGILTEHGQLDYGPGLTNTVLRMTARSPPAGKAEL